MSENYSWSVSGYKYPPDDDLDQIYKGYEEWNDNFDSDFWRSNSWTEDVPPFDYDFEDERHHQSEHFDECFDSSFICGQCYKLFMGQSCFRHNKKQKE